MKKAICFLIIFSFIIFNLQKVTHAEERDLREIDKVISLKEEAINFVKKQLVDQKAENLLPIYEQIIDEDFEYISRQLQTKSYNLRNSGDKHINMPNGGAVYYKQYLNTHVETVIVYMNKEETFNYLFNKSTSENFNNAILSFLMSNVRSPLTYILGFISSIDGFIKDEIKRIGYSKVIHTKGRDGEATIILPWYDYSDVLISDGAKYVIS